MASRKPNKPIHRPQDALDTPTQTPTNNSAFAVLAYAGTLPFVIGAIFLTFDIDTSGVLPQLGSVQHALMLYALLIASFMAGAHWGQHLLITSRWRMWLPIISNLIAIAIWLLALLLQPASFFTAAAVVFVGLLWVDYRLYRGDVISADYFRVRCRVTMIVIGLLIVSGWFSA